MFLYYAENDQVLPPAENALRLAALATAPVTVRAVTGAGHNVCLSHCSPELAQESREICVDRPGVNRPRA